MQVLQGHTQPVNVVQCDATKIVSVSDDRSVRIWNAKTGDPMQTFIAHSDVISAMMYVLIDR
jgi:WD40 repeat protein